MQRLCSTRALRSSIQRKQVCDDARTEGIAQGPIAAARPHGWIHPDCARLPRNPGTGTGDSEVHRFGSQADYTIGARPGDVKLSDLSGDGVLELAVPNADGVSVSSAMETER